MDDSAAGIIVNLTHSGGNVSAFGNNLTDLCGNQTPCTGNVTMVHSVTHLEIYTAFFFSVVFVILLLLILWVCKRSVEKNFSFWDLIMDDKWKPSLASFQFFVWTVIISFSYLFIELLRLRAGIITFPESFPANLLLLMGISVAVPIASEKIAPYIRCETPVDRPDVLPRLETMFMDNDKLTLSRVQMFLWTMIAVILYIYLLFNTVFAFANDVTTLGIPDIDVTLVVLMGLSQGAYLGNKLISQPPAKSLEPVCEMESTSSVIITMIQPDCGRPGQEISIFGKGFGNKKDGVWFNNQRIPESEITDWADDRIDLRIPVNQPSGAFIQGKYEIKVANRGDLSAPALFILY